MDGAVNVKENDEQDNNNNNKVEGNAPIASSSSCSSEDDVNGGTAVNSNWKTRASRGAATDPQASMQGRERINERLKVLQNLVPNGTKVDISTMLEEAVQYVKFLQLQIKLLSSNEMWMYAPIAYNGMDMGLYQKLSQS
ncbi:transcription factor bHLH84-like [Bidens hawaiensis]|uniref:transcription factor bHLH84-like n=1 Tax=Bidens hawaiensis TaxID=980011 RepID=UPI00404901F5